MAKEKEYKSNSDPLDKPGFLLLKSGKSLTIAGKNFIRLKDIEIKKGEKTHVEKNINKISYVKTSLVKQLGIDLKHFENEVFETIPAVVRETVKEAKDRMKKLVS